jgi:hypothetical protein
VYLSVDQQSNSLDDEYTTVLIGIEDRPEAEIYPLGGEMRKSNKRNVQRRTTWQMHVSKLNLDPYTPVVPVYCRTHYGSNAPFPYRHPYRT